MKTLNKIMKREKIELLKCKSVKTFIKENQEPFRFYKIDCPIKDEDYFYFESLVHTIQNKETIENAFIKIFDDMRDYWQTLTYEERKKLVNIELHEKIKDLIYVPCGTKRNFLPHIDEKMNRIYEDEMVLFELKQYNALRFDFKHLIQQSQLNQEMVQYGFTSLKFIEGNQEDYMAYCPINQTLYHFKNYGIVNSLTLVGFHEAWDDLKIFIHLLRNEDENGCCSFLMDKKWVSEKSCRKIEKILKKRGGI